MSTETTTSSGVALLAMCASYINTATRLKHFFVMLDSWINQEDVQCGLIISTSIVDDAIKAEFDARLDAFKRKHAAIDTTLTVLVSRVRKTQFQHYKHILERFPELVTQNPWIMFTDDDDIWHPKRTMMYHHAIEFIETTGKTGVDRVSIPYYVESTGTDVKDYATASEIDLAITTGTIKRSTCDTNYVHSCVRLERLHYFLTHSTDELVQCTYADVRFEYFVCSEGHERGKESVTTTEPWADGWLYFYRHVADPKGSITNQKDRLPNCVVYSEELKHKFDVLPAEHRRALSTILSNYDLMICMGIKDMDEIRKEDERNHLEGGMSALDIHRNIRPLYPTVDEFIKHSYYVNLRKHIA